MGERLVIGRVPQSRIGRPGDRLDMIHMAGHAVAANRVHPKMVCAVDQRPPHLAASRQPPRRNRQPATQRMLAPELLAVNLPPPIVASFRSRASPPIVQPPDVPRRRSVRPMNWRACRHAAKRTRNAVSQACRAAKPESSRRQPLNRPPPPPAHAAMHAPPAADRFHRDHGPPWANRARILRDAPPAPAQRIANRERPPVVKKHQVDYVRFAPHRNSNFAKKYAGF